MKSCEYCKYFFVSNYFTCEGELLVCSCEQFEKLDGNGYLENLQTCNLFEEYKE